MPLQHFVLQTLGKIFPPKNNPNVSEALIARHERRFKRIYIWHTLGGLCIMFGIPLLSWRLSHLYEDLLYVRRPDAFFSFTAEPGTLGIAFGMMLSFGVSVPLSFKLIEGYIGKDLMEIYKVWYDRHPSHPVNSDILARGLMWLFLPVAALIPLYMRYDYTFVTQDYLIEGRPWTLSERTLPLSDIRAVEMQIGRKAASGEYRPGFCYRFRFEGAKPWESDFFSGTEANRSLHFRPMIDYVLQKTGLPLTEIATPAE